VGLNAGEPIAEDEDLFGTAVNLAARICGHAEAGQILASDVVRQLVAGKDFLFTDRGEASLKGFDEPVRLYEVRWQEGQVSFHRWQDFDVMLPFTGHATPQGRALAFVAHLSPYWATNPGTRRVRTGRG
jgi:hypothetical protein